MTIPDPLSITTCTHLTERTSELSFHTDSLQTLSAVAAGRTPATYPIVHEDGPCSVLGLP